MLWRERLNLSELLSFLREDVAWPPQPSGVASASQHAQRELTH